MANISALDLADMQDPHATRAPVFLAVTIPLAIITTTTYAARIYSRLAPKRHLNWDDLAITLGFVRPPLNRNLLIRAGIYIHQLDSLHRRHQNYWWTPHRIHPYDEYLQRAPPLLLRPALLHFRQYLRQGLGRAYATVHKRR